MLGVPIVIFQEGIHIDKIYVHGLSLSLLLLNHGVVRPLVLRQGDPSTKEIVEVSDRSIRIVC